jgi:hypothetical protein
MDRFVEFEDGYGNRRLYPVARAVPSTPLPVVADLDREMTKRPDAEVVMVAIRKGSLPRVRPLPRGSVQW